MRGTTVLRITSTPRITMGPSGLTQRAAPGQASDAPALAGRPDLGAARRVPPDSAGVWRVSAGRDSADRLGWEAGLPAPPGLGAASPARAPDALALEVRLVWEAVPQERPDSAGVPPEQDGPGSVVRLDWAGGRPAGGARSAVTKDGRHTLRLSASGDTTACPAGVDSAVIASAGAVLAVTALVEVDSAVGLEAAVSAEVASAVSAVGAGVDSSY
jgi:hypothetical protein